MHRDRRFFLKTSL